MSPRENKAIFSLSPFSLEGNAISTDLKYSDMEENDQDCDTLSKLKRRSKKNEQGGGEGGRVCAHETGGVCM